MPARHPLRPTLTTLAWAAAIAVTTAGTWGLLRPVNVPPIAFTSGITVAAVWISGPFAAVAVFLGIALGAASVHAPWFMALRLGGAIAAQSLLAWVFLRRAFRGRLGFASVLDAAKLFGASLAAILVGATAFTPLYARLSGATLGDRSGIWLYLVTSQMLAVLMVAPALAHAAGSWPWRARWPRDRASAEAAACAALVLVLSACVFFAPRDSSAVARLLPLAILPLVAWTAVRGPMGLSLALPGLFMIVAIAGTARHLGILGGHLLPSSLITLQALAGMLGSTCLGIATTERARRDAQDEVLGREAQLKRVLDGSNDGFWEWDATAGTLLVSGRIREMVGGAGHSFARYPEDFESLTHPEDAAEMIGRVREHLASGTAPLRAEYRMRRADGGWMWVVQRGGAPERDARGRALRVSGVLSDISARKRAERELVASRALFESFMRNSPSPAFIRDGEGRMLYVNPAMEDLLWGDQVPEWRGRRLDELVAPEVAAEALRDSDRHLAQGGSMVYEQHLELPHGTVDLLTIRFVLRGADDELLVGGMALDVTARRRAEDERRTLEARLTETQKLESLGLLAGGVAHDFNNILTSILGYAELASEGLPPGAPARADLAHIVTGARRAAELTRRMLAYAGRTTTLPSTLSLPHLVQETGELLQVSIPRRVALQYDFAPELPALLGDEAQLRQVVMNLVLNAAEAIDEGNGTIRVRLRSGERTAAQLASRWTADDAEPGAYVWLEVEDDGSGMPADTLARIFDPFFTTKFTGRGLGLAAVLGIVRAHRGGIQVESAPGAGTLFRVLLPAEPGRVVPDEPPSALAPWRASGLALVIDDEPGVRDLATAMLRRAGFDAVLTAGGGAEGVERFRERADEVRFVLLDLTMPDLGGLEVLRAIRAIRADVPVVLSSGYADPAGTAGAGAEDATGFVAKPYRLADLTRAVRAALGGVPA